MPDSRYPYTYAADFLRAIPEMGPGGTKLSRSEASQMIEAIADAIGWKKETLAARLAEAELAKTDGDRDRQANKVLAAVQAALRP